LGASLLFALSARSVRGIERGLGGGLDGTAGEKREARNGNIFHRSSSPERNVRQSVRLTALGPLILTRPAGLEPATNSLEVSASFNHLKDWNLKDRLAQSTPLIGCSRMALPHFANRLIRTRSDLTLRIVRNGNVP
jgi:hypothetical protein